MTMQPVIKPQETKPAPLPAYPVAPPSQTQTSSRGMVPPRHYADGTAEVPAAAATDPGWAERVRLNTALNPRNGAVPDFPIQPGPAAARAAGFSPTVPSFAGAPTPTASEIMAAHRGAFAQAVFGGIAPQAPAVTAGATPGGAMAAPAPAPAAMPTVARGVDTGGLESGGDGVILKGQPYASTPQQVATAAANTGANPAALQNAAGAARDAQVPGQPPNMDAVQHALANPEQYNPANFVDALRGVSFRHLAMVAGALRTAMPYNPQEQAYQQLHNHRTNALKGMTKPQQQKQLDAIEQMEELRAGVFPYQRMPQMRTDANGIQVDEYGNPVQ